MEPIVIAGDIKKSYGPAPALKGVSFSVAPGEIFGIIGPDGAGKTSLFRILATLLLPDGGHASICGLDVVEQYRQIRCMVGYMPGRFSLYPDLTVEENLTFFATLFHTTLRENYNLVKDIYSQIEPFKNRRAGKLSGGMKQKLALSCALIHKPAVLLLDEPTTGVDPVSRKEFWEMLTHLKEEGIAIIVSTPYMDEAKRCDRIALIKDGAFLQIETPQSIVRSFREILWSVRSDRMYALLNDLRNHRAVKTCFAFGDVHHITVGPPRGTDIHLFPALTPETLREYLQQKGHAEIEIKPITPTIEDCYLKLAQEGRSSAPDDFI